MKLSSIVVAADESEAGRYAVRWGLYLGRRTGARITVIRAVLDPGVASRTPVTGKAGGSEADELDRFAKWLEPELRASPGPPCTPAIVHGVPSVEIPRFAERLQAGLVVLGRKARSQTTRLLLGDTADAVARRSQVPCAFVPIGAAAIRRVLVALDGSARGLAVLKTAAALVEATGADVRFVTVEPARADEDPTLAHATPLARTDELRRYLAGQPDVAGAGGDRLIVRRGPPPDRILETAAATKADVIVVGHRRGGPAGIAEAGSTGRRVMHTAPGIVVTVPL